MEGLVVDFALPSLLNTDVDEVKKILKHSGRRLLSGGSSYRFDLFSATDYLYVSTLVAKEFPNLVESKLVLMHRDPLPERLYQRRHMLTRSSRRSHMPWWDVISASLLTVILYFAAMPHDIQRAFVHVFPAIIFVVLGFGLLLYESNPIVFVFSVIFATVTLGSFFKFIYSTMRESPEDRRRQRSVRLSQNGIGKKNDNNAANKVKPSAGDSDDMNLHFDDDEFLLSYPDTSSDEGSSSDDSSSTDGFNDDINNYDNNNNNNNNNDVEASSEEDDVVTEIRTTDKVLNHSYTMRATTTNRDTSGTFKPSQRKPQNQHVTEQPRERDHRRPSLDVDEDELPEEETTAVTRYSLANIKRDSFELSSSDSDLDNSNDVVVTHRRAKGGRNKKRNNNGGMRAIRNIRSGRRGNSSGLNKAKSKSRQTIIQVKKQQSN
jgi:hypothetical protein